MSALFDLAGSKLGLKERLVCTKAFPKPEALAIVAPVVAESREWDWTVTQALCGLIEDAGDSIEQRWLAADSPWRSSQLGRWLLAESWSRAGRKTDALALWGEIISAGGQARAEALLARARLRRDLNDLGGAFEDLHAASGLDESFAFLNKAARLLDRLTKVQPMPGKPMRIALLCSSTADLLVPLLRLACFREGFAAELYVAPYGSYRQEILDPESGLYRFAPDVVIIGTHWRDAHLGAIGTGGAEQIEGLWKETVQSWQNLLSRHTCMILQHGFDLPRFDAGGYLSAAALGGRARLLRELNARLWRERPAGVVVVDLESLEAQVGLSIWEDPVQWHLAKQHPGSGALPALVGRYGKLIRARFGLSKKVLALDLDNTLWGGVVGEDGVGGLQIGPPSAVGEAYAAFQSYVHELKERGILLAVCSKNNEADAREPFR